MSSTTERGYGRNHQRQRNIERPSVEAGERYCVYCRRPIVPGTKWHLAHHDIDRNIYIGVAHAKCNLKMAGKIGRAKQLSRLKVLRTSRAW